MKCFHIYHYGIRGISNDWFRSYLSDKTNFTSIDCFNSDYKNVEYCIINTECRINAVYWQKLTILEVWYIPNGLMTDWVTLDHFDPQNKLKY